MARIITLLILVASISFGASQTCTNAVNYWTKKLDIPKALVWAIILNESKGRWWVHSDDRDVLQTRDWCLSIVRQFRLDPSNPKIWWSVGVMQVNYLVALDLGYRGGPELLRDSRTNVKYGCIRLNQIRKHHQISGMPFSVENWVWHYNQSSQYVIDVIRTYNHFRRAK
jgi:hypothetical protein